MAALLLTLLASTGLCLIIKHSSLLEGFRVYVSSKITKAQELFNCSLCLGFWTGLAIGATSEFNMLKIGLASAVCSWLVDHTILLMRKFIWPD
jgi:hypothetical protein